MQVTEQGRAVAEPSVNQRPQGGIKAYYTVSLQIMLMEQSLPK